jgi:hypothetical protein
MKILSGRLDRVHRRITSLDLWENRFMTIDLPQADPACACCGEHSYEYLDGVQGAEAVALCGRSSVQIRRRDGAKFDLAELAGRLAPLGALNKNRYLVRIEIDRCLLTVFADGRAIVSGTGDPGVAKSIYSRYVGS